MIPLRVVSKYGTVLVLLFLSACFTGTPNPPPAELLSVPPTGVPCEACAQATVASALTQERNNADNLAAATAEVMRANAQAALNSANATLGAAQTQQQNNADVIAAQIAGTAEIVRADALATVNSAGSTQNAALTQDAIRQTQMADLATSGALAMVNQQYRDELAAGTQTAVSNTIATQTQAGAATSQWFSDQTRRREEQRQGPIAFLWIWCVPLFLLLFAGLVVWGFWRWQRIQQANQLLLENYAGRLPAPAHEVSHHHHDDSLPYLESEIVDGDAQPTKPDDRVRHWLDEVKRKLLRSDRKDAEDDTNN